MPMLPFIGLGLAVGLVAGLLGIGGGALCVPALVYFAGMPIHQAVGISIAVTAPSAITGFLTHYSSGNIPISPTLYIVPTAILGAFVGAFASPHVPAGALRILLGVLLIVAGLNLILVRS